MRLGTIAELSNSLKWTIDVSCSRYLLHERIALAEDIAPNVYEILSMRSVLDIIRGEDKCLGKTPVTLLMFKGVSLYLFKYPFIRIGRGNFGFDLRRFESALVLE